MITIKELFNTEISINKKINRIEIPEIQRDYIQGLEEYSNKLDKFLDVLFNALSSKNKCSLDFIYGNINEDGVFEPIDGQQRITTLALLYYYIENICKKNNDNIFKKITYKTKNTATEFCELLSSDDFISYLRDSINNKIDNVIKDYHAYYDIYDYDLTIKSIINTLKAIQEKYDKLNDKNNISFDNITFQIFPMKSFNLSDDLYIKMNGRGKQLSSFDNFKADYFKWLEENINIIDELIPNITESSEDNNKDKEEEEEEEEEEEKERKKHKLETLKRKFDTDYIDIFWDYAFENSKDTSEAPDPEKLFFRFINRFVVGKILSMDINDKTTNDELKKLICGFLLSNRDLKKANEDEKDKLKKFIHQFLVNDEDSKLVANMEKEELKKLVLEFLINSDDLKNQTASQDKDIINILIEDNKSKIDNFIADMENYFFNKEGSRTEDDSIQYTKFDCYGFILLKYNKNLINILENLYSIKDEHKQDNFIDILSKYFKANWEDKFNIFNDFKNYKELFVYNTILSFLENRLPEEYIEKEIQCLSRLVWNVAEQYDLVTGIYKNTYISIANRFEFLSKISNDSTKDNNSLNSIYSYFFNANENYHLPGNLKIIIEDEVKKCQYIFEKTSLEQDFIELEKLPYLKGTIGFLLGNDKNNFEIIYKTALSEFEKYVEIHDDKKNKKYFIDNTNNYLFNRNILYKYFLNNQLEIEKYNEKLFTLDALKVDLIKDNNIRQFAFEFIKNSNALIDSANFINNYMSKMYINEHTVSLQEKDKSFVYITSFLDSLYMLLYAKDDSDYLINNYYILDEFLPCIIHKNCHGGYFASSKRLNSIFGDTYIIDTINKIIDKCKNLPINLKTIPNEIKIFIDNDNDSNKKRYNNIVAPVGDREIQLSFEINNKQYVFILNNGIGIKYDNEVKHGIWIPIQSIEHLKELTEIIIKIICKLTNDENNTLSNIIDEIIRNKDLSDTFKDNVLF